MHPMPSLSEIRSTFLSYFERKEHKIVPSSSLVPKNDPTLMFVNSGMVQFKNLFTGVETRSYCRAATSQKCVRAGGKHNDLDNVGYTARHHTFFEMLGNFSFGDYFKEQAIVYCWDLITKEFGVPKERLLATIYVDDDEAYNLWKKYAGLPDERIIRIATADNFWTMGPVGPCGPCTELYFDYGEEVPGGPPGSPDEDGDRFTEIWNLVFMQFEQFNDGRMDSLPKPSVDTGMGLERIGALLQGKSDNYDTDLFRGLIEASAKASSTEPDGEMRNHHRVIADHLRSTAFLIAEGVLPSKDGRGYVLRRIMRRAIRHAHQLGSREPLLHRLVSELVRQMGSAFPELVQARTLIVDTIFHEENRFNATLERGLRLLEDVTKALPDQSPLPGAVAFKLYDTFGFPLDLTQDVMREHGRGVDTAGFHEAMEDQRQRARAAWKGTDQIAEDAIWFSLADEFGTTEFLGYQTVKAECLIRTLVRNGVTIENANSGEEVQIVLNQTPFYAEAGGQVGDTGLIRVSKGTAEVIDTQRKADLIVHSATVTSGAVSAGSFAEALVDQSRRGKICANHSGTHLLHEALRQELGRHVAQRGSVVDSDRLRFDFSHSKAMTAQEISAVEAKVNALVRQNSQVETKLMTPDEGRAIGAQALFGEKYSDEVRVVSMGVQEGSGKGRSGEAVSVELCGGTHVPRTGDIGLFVALGESAVSAGVRRIEALTGEAARLHFSVHRENLAEIAIALKAQRHEVVEKVKTIVAERRKLQQKIDDFRKRPLDAGAGLQSDQGSEKTIGGTKIYTQFLLDISGKELRPLIDRHKSRLESGVVFLIGKREGKVSAAIGVTEDLAERVSAVEIMRQVTPLLGGKGGGGRADFAQGGGIDANGCREAFKKLEHLIGGLK